MPLSHLLIRKPVSRCCLTRQLSFLSGSSINLQGPSHLFIAICYALEPILDEENFGEPSWLPRAEGMDDRGINLSAIENERGEDGNGNN